jgi:hypothetical protein
MHDCRKINSKIVDLVFGETEAGEKSSLLAELENCAACLDEYRSMTSALLVFDEAAEASLPDESYWPAHRAALNRSIELAEPFAAAATIRPARAPFWKRVFSASLPVPVPVAGLVAVALLVSSVLALRPSNGKAAMVPRPAVTTTEAAVAAPAPPKIIEVPVYRERVITRTVYVEKKVREKREARPSAAPNNRGGGEGSLTARKLDAESVEGGFFTRANLTDYQPADDMKIRVIRRSNTDEN